MPSGRVQDQTPSERIGAAEVSFNGQLAALLVIDLDGDGSTRISSG